MSSISGQICVPDLGERLGGTPYVRVTFSKTTERSIGSLGCPLTVSLLFG